jgi:hypothetical protein
MAQKTFIQLVDDIDGTPIADGEGRTVTFAIDGASYEIDLTDAHVAELVYALEPFTSGGRRTGRKTSAPAAGPARPARSPTPPSCSGSASGHARTATTCPTAVASRVRSARRTTRLTETGLPQPEPRRRLLRDPFATRRTNARIGVSQCSEHILLDAPHDPRYSTGAAESSLAVGLRTEFSG